MSQREEQIRREPLHRPRVTRTALWFGLLGGGAAWTAHLLSAYFIAEFGCISGLGARSVLGITVVAWLIIGVSVVTLLVALAAVRVAHRSRERLAVEPLEGEEPSAEFELARTGFMTSALFAFIILIESIPIFFFLKNC